MHILPTLVKYTNNWVKNEVCWRVFWNEIAKIFLISSHSVGSTTMNHADLEQHNLKSIRFVINYVMAYALLVTFQTAWKHQIHLAIVIDGWVQDCSNSITSALELLQSCPKPSIWPAPKICVNIIFISTAERNTDSAHVCWPTRPA